MNAMKTSAYLFFFKRYSIKLDNTLLPFKKIEHTCYITLAAPGLPICILQPQWQAGEKGILFTKSLRRPRGS